MVVAYGLQSLETVSVFVEVCKVEWGLMVAIVHAQGRVCSFYVKPEAEMWSVFRG